MNRERIIELVDEDDKELLKEEAIELVLIKEENSVFPEDNIDAYQGETETIAADLMCESDYDDEKEVFIKQEHISDIHMFDVKSNYISCYEPQCSFKCATVEEYGKHIGTHKHIIALSCNYCDMVCKGMKQYYSHLKTHGQQPRKRIARQPRARKVLLPKSSIECPQCGLVAKDKQFLAVHMGRYHGPLVDCPICHKKKRKVLMAAHLRTHKNQLSCTECNITFESTKLFNRHELLQHPKICLICSKKFSVVRYLRKHIMRHGDAIKDIECEHCHRMFKSEASIRCHLRYRAKNNDVCMPPFCKETYGRIRRSRQVPIICPICGKAVMDYVTHVRRHTSQKEYKCSECPYESKYPTNYRRHMLTHSGDKPFLCTDCGLSFIQKTMLDSHARQHEICEEPIKCKYCELTFPTKFDFKVHRESHGIGKHTKLLYGSTSDADVVSYARMRREFICSICDKAWASRAMLQSHLRAHSDVRPFRCDICPSTFKFKFALRVHTENVHEDRRPFSCKVCKKAFRHELALRDHARTHTGERLECGRCDKTFASSSNRSKHLREVHNVRFRTIYTTKIIKNKLHSTS